MQTNMVNVADELLHAYINSMNNTPVIHHQATGPCSGKCEECWLLYVTVYLKKHKYRAKGFVKDTCCNNKTWDACSRTNDTKKKKGNKDCLYQKRYKNNCLNSAMRFKQKSK